MNGWIERSRAFVYRAKWSLLLPACTMAFLWFFSGTSSLSEEETALWRKVRSAQEHLFEWRETSSIASLHPEHDFAKLDPWRTGFIGIEWSQITTTLGPLEAKRTAADPLWSAFALRKFRALGLRSGDTVAMLSSSSFPGLVFSLLAAAEHLGLRIVWIHSLGSSTWGANIPELPWPKIEARLRSGGFLSQKPDYYTLGGRNENGLDMSPEGRELLLAAAREDGVPLIGAESLDEMILLKSNIVLSAKPRLVLIIGGSHSTFGAGEIVSPEGGLYTRDDGDRADVGEGVFRKFLDAGVPVLYFLNLRSLSERAGIPYDGRPLPHFGGGASDVACAGGLLLYFVFLQFFRRWGREE